MTTSTPGNRATAIGATTALNWALLAALIQLSGPVPSFLGLITLGMLVGSGRLRLAGVLAGLDPEVATGGYTEGHVLSWEAGMANHDDTYSHNHAHAGGHGHAHGHTHDHAPEVTADSEKRVRWAMLLTGGFMLAEAVGGWLSGSLALLADAGHMFSDSASLALAWLAFRLGTRAPDRQRTYGYRRFQVLAAFVNGLTLLAIGVAIVIAAIQRLREPVEVLAGPMLAIAVLGLAVNVAVFAILHRGDRDNLNLRGALLHVIGDLLGSVAAIAASLIIMFTGWYAADPLLSMLAAVLILRGAWQIVRRSAHTLLEGTPEGVEVGEIRAALEGLDGVESLHDLHLWGLTPQDPLLSLHLVVRDDADHAGVLRQAYALLRERFGITHATLQLEGEACLTGGGCQAMDTTSGAEHDRHR